MSGHYQGNHRLNEFVPTYQPHSDYLPNRVIEGHQTEANQWLSNYEAQKRAGHVYSQKPVEFNSGRYVSVQTSERVLVNQPISESQFNSRVRRH